jgi:hypothetical protein
MYSPLSNGITQNMRSSIWPVHDENSEFIRGGYTFILLVIASINTMHNQRPLPKQNKAHVALNYLRLAFFCRSDENVMRKRQ